MIAVKAIYPVKQPEEKAVKSATARGSGSIQEHRSVQEGKCVTDRVCLRAFLV
jgi:hypothetical protein